MKYWLLVPLILLVIACDSNTDETPSSDTIFVAGIFENANNFVNKCEVPRSGIDPATQAPFEDEQGTGLDERNWLRSWSNDFYLWYDEIIDRDPENFTTPEYFALLKTEELTENGNPRDQFHFTVPTANFFQTAIQGDSVSTGINWVANQTSPPRDFTVAYINPDSSAFDAGVSRGDLVLEIDGVSVVNDSSDSGINTINQGLFPSTAGETIEFRFRRTDNSEYTVDLDVELLMTSPVLLHQTISTSTGNVGYLVFNDHSRVAEQQLITAFEDFSADGVSDIVLDLRYNGGGFLFIASQIGYMIAGDTATANKSFERLVFNDKHTEVDPFTLAPLQPTPFFRVDTSGSPLPTLNLNRVFVITTGSTCSASESIINSLRGIDVDVIQIGETTCGKPFGFYATDNCGTTYFSIHFRGENHKGFGDYADGFIPSAIDNQLADIRGCVVADDLTHVLGDSDEAMLAQTLFYRENNECSVAIQKAQTPPKLRIHTNEVLQNKVIQ